MKRSLLAVLRAIPQESYVDICYNVLDECTSVIAGYDIGREGGVLKTDLLACAIWVTGLLHP